MLQKNFKNLVSMAAMKTGLPLFLIILKMSGYLGWKQVQHLDAAA